MLFSFAVLLACGPGLASIQTKTALGVLEGREVA
jgi:hypothetical protein